MPPLQRYRKRRKAQEPNKNELKVARGEAETRHRTQAGTLRERFPHVTRLELDLRMVTPAGATLQQEHRLIQGGAPLLLDIPCQGGCGNGLFLLTQVVEEMLPVRQELREGMGLCQGISYADPKALCNTKLIYRIEASYSPTSSQS
ncbi:MAG: hypothetical protein HYZ73_08705 [Elusimicrobia bacterium]|nr:hypothetical protein [Elusimicrobiota bacterium]